MSVFSTGPSGGVIAKALSDVLGIGASIDGQGRFLSRLGPAIRRVVANPNGTVSDYGGSLALDPQNGALYLNQGVGNVPSVNWANLAYTSNVAVFGQFADTITRALVAGTTYTQDFTVTEDSNGVSVTNDGLGNPTQLTVATAGVYAFTISPQLLKGGGGQTNISFWAELNGVPITRSASVVDLPNNVQILPFIELIVRMNAGQYLQWNFRTPGNGVSITNIAAAAPVPQAPAVIAGVKRLGS
jgi:hypothetical protein